MKQFAEETPDITLILQELSDGKREVFDSLMPLVYEELRRQAASFMRRERADHTLQTTALIHEAFLKLVNQKDVRWQNRAHFFAIAATAMRRILVDYAKTRNREKRGGDAVLLQLDENVEAFASGKNIDLEALDEALNRLAQFDERQARIVELRYFSGLTEQETAEVIGVSPATVRLDWKMAKAWLRNQLIK